LFYCADCLGLAVVELLAYAKFRYFIYACIDKKKADFPVLLKGTQD
jgi:hypothetical protein